MHIRRAAESGLIGTCCLLLLQACAGNGHGLDANGRPLGEGSGSSGGGGSEVTADFDSIQDHVFTPICTACHAGGGAPEGLRLDEPNAYNLLVNVPSTEVPTLMRVKPGDPDNSYIIQKLEGHAAVGARMPLGGPYLPDATVAAIRQWISAGATAPTPAAAPFALKLMLPAAGETVTRSPPQVLLGFTQELDTTQLGGLTARLQAADGRAIPARISVPAGNAHVLLLTPGSTLASGHYEVRIEGPVGAEVRNVRGETLRLGAPDANGQATLPGFDVEVLP